ncbi:MAG: glycosyltransferase [Phormidium sp. BM_Day4_Bin.17]|nr:glycosyltransferase [Phormidium sp. BM_Day4_Bin.17]
MTTTTQPLVSILTFVYNRKDLLIPCLESALAQTVQDFELILVDNASTDGTWEICQEFARKDSRIRIFRNETNLGPVRNWIRSIEEARGKYAKVLLSDDLISPTFLEKTVPYLENNPEIGFVYTAAEIGTAPGQGKVSYLRGNQPTTFSTREYITYSLFHQGYVVPNSPGASLFRLKDLQDNVLLEVPSPTIHDFPDHAMGTDILLYLLTCKRYPLVAHIPESLAFFRAHSGSVTTSTLSQKPDLWTFCYQQVKIWFAREYEDSSTLQALLAVEWVRDFHKQKQWSSFREIASRYLHNVDQWVSVGESSDLLNDLRYVRHHITQVWLNLTSENELGASWVGNLGLVNRTIRLTSLRDELPTPDDQTTIAQLRQTLSQGLQAPGALQAFLCATLYGYPHQFNIQYHNAPIPNWMTELYLTYLFESPRLFKDLGEVDQYHQYFTDWTHYLQQKRLSQPDSPASQLLAKAYANLANLTPLCFSRRDSRRVQETRAALLEQYLEQQGAQLDYTFPPRPEQRPIRFGILCLNTLPSAETFTTLPAFQHLDRNQFHIYLYALQTTGHPYERHCQDCADQVRTLPADNLQEMVNQVRADDLDVLLIGTNITARSYPLTLLSLHRLARIQATGLSAPTTTGMRNLDIYIGGSLTATNPDHYSEQLVTVEGSGLCFQFPSDDDRPSISLDRANWGLAPDTTVFISGANFRKINPELRDSWAKLLAQVPNSILVLYPFGPNWGRHPQLERPFFQQMQQALARHNVDPKRLLLIKTLPNRADVRLALQQADIYLDSFPYSGAASVLDPLRVGLPIVALEGSELRFRQSAALLRELGQPDLIAQTEAEYRQLAVQLAHDPQQRQAKRQQIQAAMAQTPPFLDSRGFSAKIGTLLQQLVAGDLPTASDSSPLPPPEEQHPSSQAFINRTIGCCNIYYIDPSEQPIIEELRQLRRQLVEYWLTLPDDQLPLAYNGEIGKAFKALLKSDVRQEPLTPEEETYRQQLTEQGAGLVKPQALNALMGAMLYYPVEQMKVRDADTRLPDWLYPDYAAVFEAPATEPEPPAPTTPPTPPLTQPSPTGSPIMGATAPATSFPADLLQGLDQALNQYATDPSNAEVILQLRNLRHQLILKLASYPLETVAQAYGGELGRVYKKLLRSGFQKQPLADIEVQTRAKLSEAWKNRHAQDVNAMMGLFLYFPPGTMKIQEPTTRLPDWLLPDYREVFEAALPADGVPKAVSSEQLPPPSSDPTTPSAPLPDEPVPSASFLNRLLGTVNLYQIDPTDATILGELRQIRRRFVDHWLTVPQGELERVYYEDLGRGYRILLTSGFQKQPLTPEETQYRQDLTQKGGGLTEPQSLNALMGAMLYYPTDQLRVQDAATRLPSWLLPDYEAVFEGKAQQQPSVQPPSPEFGQQVATLIERLRQNPNDGAALVLLRQARQALCQYWLSLPAEQLPGAYGGPMGEVQRRLMSCGLRGLPRTGAEQSLFEQLRGELSQGMSGPKSVQCFLAAMLLCPPDQLRLSSAHGLLPTWLVGDYERVFLVTG